MKWLHREKRVCIVLGAQIIIFVACVIVMCMHGQKLVSYSIPLDFFVEETMGAGTYEIVPAGGLLLPKGHYFCRLVYRGSSEGSYLLPGFSDTENFSGIQANIPVREGLTEGVDEFWLDADTESGFSFVYNGVGNVSVEGLYIEETMASDRIRIFGVLVLFLLMDIFYLVVKKSNYFKSVQNRAIVIGILILILLTSYPLTLGYPIAGDDIDFHLGRIEGMAQAFREGQIPQRLNPVFFEGYGYANPIFYGELFLVFPAVMRLIGFRLTTCYMVLVFLINVLTCVLSCYCFGKIFGKKKVGLVVAFLYCLAPYRLVDVYSRAAVGEYTAMAFLPLIFWGMYQIYSRDTEDADYGKSFLPLMIGLSGIVQSHILTGEMTAVFLILTCIIFWKRTFQKRRLLELVKSVVGTILVNAWFLVPFLDYAIHVPVKSLQNSHFQPIQDQGAFWAQIIGFFVSPLRGTMPSNKGIVGEMPFTIGTPLVLGQFLCVFMLFTRKQLAGKTEKKRVSGAIYPNSSLEDHNRRSAVCAVFSLAMAVLASWMSTVYFPWDAIAHKISILALPITSLQFPWRMLAIAVLFASVAAGIGLSFLEEKLEKYYIPAMGILMTFAVIGGMFMMQTPMQSNYPYTSNNLKKMDSCVAGGYEEYLPVDAERASIHGNLGLEVIDGVKVTGYLKKGCTIWLDVDATDSGGSVVLPLLAYKGYRCEWVGSGQSEQKEKMEVLEAWGDGRIAVHIEAGLKGRLKIYFREPIVWRVTEIISLMSIIMIFMLFRRKRR